MENAEAAQNADNQLTPWGRLITGQPGISAARLAEALGVSVALVRRLAQPIGVMKLPYRNAFAVYDPGLVEKLADHPEVLKSRARLAGRAEAAQKAADTRRAACVRKLSSGHPELVPLYERLVERLWSPSSERKLLDDPLYAEFPYQLWKALMARPDHEQEAIELIVNILWAMDKERTWKVNELGEQEVPLAWSLWEQRIGCHGKRAKELYRNVFAAGLRHMAEDKGDIEGNKFERRQEALRRLGEISARDWAEDG
jgi:hypothetical protein